MITASVCGFTVTDDGDSYLVTPDAEWEALTMAQQDAVIEEFLRVTAWERWREEALEAA